MKKILDSFCDYKSCVIVLFLFVLPFITQAQVKTVVLKGNNGYMITNQVGLYTSSSDSININSIQDISFEIQENTMITLNINERVKWVKIPVRNESDIEKWYLEIGNGMVEVEIFIPISDSISNNKFKKVALGQSQPFSERILKTDQFLLPINFPKNKEITIYLRLESDYFQGALSIAPIEYYFERDHKIDMLEGMYYGFVVVMVFYNLFIFFTVREKGYLLYVLSLISLGLASAQLKGHNFEYLWFNFPQVNQYAPTIHCVAGIFAMLFLINFLNTKKNSRFFYIGFYCLITLFSIGIVVNLLGFNVEASATSQLVAMSSALYSLVAAVYIYYKGYQPAKFVVIAWSFYLIGIILFILAGAGVLPHNMLTSNSTLIGSAIEMVLLSVALAAKIDYYKKEKEELQKEVLKAAEAQARLIKNQNKILEQKVAERTEELNTINEDLSNNLVQLNEKNILIDKKNQDITSSINYAKQIQDAILPEKKTILESLPHSFVFFQPKDIVSGDFYYFKKVDKRIVFGAFDCTGHGVPGAFMSLIGNELLNEIIELNYRIRASEILDELDKRIIKALRQTDTSIRDGMDAAICVYDFEKQILEYAGAKNPLIYVENDEVKVIKADRQSIGGNIAKSKFDKQSFTTHTFDFK